MRKVVFKGVINGEEFDNVKDYNDRINKLLAEGTSISANSNTQVVEEPEVKEEKEEVSDLRSLLANLTPYFNEEDEHYLDRLVTGDKEFDQRRLIEVENRLEDAKKNLEKVLDIDEFDLADALELMNEYKNVRNGILEDQYTNSTLTNNLKEEIKHDEDQLKVLEGSAPFIKTLLDFYTGAFNILRNHILKNN